MTNENTFYRYRSIGHLNSNKEETCIKWNRFIKELQNQEMYFSPLEDLNDPMEGMSNVYWEGDSIIWENLIRNYLLVLMWTFDLYFLTADSDQLKSNDIHTRRTPDDFPTPEYRDRYEDFCRVIFQEKPILELPAMLEKRGRIGRAELISYLFGIHLFCINTLIENSSKRGLCPALKPFKKDEIQKSLTDNEKLIYAIKQIEQDNKDKSSPSEIIFQIQQHTNEKIGFNHYYSYRIRNELKNSISNTYFIISSFPKLYVDRLIQDSYPNYYTVSFSSRNDSPAMWGHYANGHKGVCLQFTFDIDNTSNISVSLLNSSKFIRGTKTSTDTNYQEGRMQLHSVKYGNDFPTSNYFENIGRLSFLKIKKYWWEKNGQYSSIMNYYKNMDEWRIKYWDNYYTYNTFKYSEWKYEDEKRLILQELGGGEIEKAHRIKHYDFKYLTGIIFGMKTTDEEKFEIIKIIEQKCKENGRTDFKYYQAHFPVHGNKMIINRFDF